MAIADRDIRDEINAEFEELAAAAERLQRSTVQVRGRGPGGGSGVIWRPDGLIVTNAHVARGNQAEVELWDGRVLPAEVTLSDRERDLAALTVSASDLPAAPIGDASGLRVGELVMAVGNPLGLTGAMTVGIVHAVAPMPGHNRSAWVQADIRLAPGNSGGPLADVRGRVIGINSMVAGGLGLAVPSNTVQRFLRDRGSRPRLGVTIQPVLLPGRPPLPGFLLLEVAAGSPAAAAGLLIGDVVVGIDGQPVGDPRQLSLEPGTSLHLDLLRGGTRISKEILVPVAEGREAA